MKLLQCPDCRTYTPAIRRDDPLLILACRVCGRDVVWRAVFARRQELRVDAAALAECRAAAADDPDRRVGLPTRSRPRRSH